MCQHVKSTSSKIFKISVKNKQKICSHTFEKANKSTSRGAETLLCPNVIKQKNKYIYFLLFFPLLRNL